MRYGVWDGSSVQEFADGPSAFRAEAALRAKRVAAQAVWLDESGLVGVWLTVPPGDPARPSPAPPPQPRQLPWYDRLGRGGTWLAWAARRWPRKPTLFGRRR